MNQSLLRRALLAVMVWVSAATVYAQGTAFTYQGQLMDGGAAANGNYDLRFALFDAYTNGNAIGLPQTNLAVPVANGVFITNVDFGSVWLGAKYWLALGVRTNGNTGPFTLLWPRQQLTPVPYAIFSEMASNLTGTLPVGQLAGTLTATQLAGTYQTAVSFTNANNVFAGNGSNLTMLNGSQVTLGTVADARLSGNVALLNTNQTFTGIDTFAGTNTFTGPVNSSGTNLFIGPNSFTNRLNAFTGTFFGNGLVGWIPVSGTSTQAVANAGYLLLNTNLTTVTLPASASLFVGDIVRISGPGSGGWKLAQNSGQSVAGFFFTPSNSSWVVANVTSGGWSAVASSSDGVKIVAGQPGVSTGIDTSPDSGQTWNVSSAAFAPTSLASSGDGTRLVGAVYNGGVIMSTNSGSTWTAITPGGVAWTGIASSSDGSKFAACISNSTVYTWSSFGAVSNFTVSLVGVGLTGIACSSDCSRQVVSSTGSTYTSSDSGNTFATSGTSPANCTCVASSADGFKLAAAVKGGHIYTSTDAGATWTQQANSPTGQWSSIACSRDGGRIVATINGGGIYFSANYGLTWTVEAVSSQNWRAVTCSADASKVVAAYATTLTSGGIYYWDASLESTTTTTGGNGSVTGGPGTAVELQYIGNGQFMPISSIGTFWSN